MQKLSIIIPTLNEAANITRLVSYLWAHADDRLAEIIVVDGGSVDGTQKMLQGLNVNMLLCPLANRAAQMNMGARHASSEILYFVHADTLPPIAYLTDIFDALKNGHVMGCYRYRFDSPRVLLRINSWFTRFSFLWCQGGDKTFFISKNVFEQENGYNEAYCIMEEYDFLRRVAGKYKLLIMPKDTMVSARKYENKTWLYVQLVNFWAFTLFRWKVNPVKVKNFYHRALK